MKSLHAESNSVHGLFTFSQTGIESQALDFKWWERVGIEPTLRYMALSGFRQLVTVW